MESLLSESRPAVDPLLLEVFQAKSYLVLSQEAKNRVKTYVQTANFSESITTAAAAAVTGGELDFRTVYLHRHDLEDAVLLQTKRLTAIRPLLFSHVDALTKKQWAQDLYLAFFLYSARYQLYAAEIKEDTWLDDAALRDKHEHEQSIYRCLTLLQALHQSNQTQTTETVFTLSYDYDDAASPVGYAAAQIAMEALDETIKEMAVVGDSLSFLTWLNGWRLYWVWAKSLIGSVFDALQKQASQNRLGFLSLFSGHMSYSLYGLRGGVKIARAVVHTVDGFGLSEKEGLMSFWERLACQMDLHKFDIMNDFFWGWANLACFYWLVGDALTGSYAGDVVTLGLLIMDLGLTYWRFSEKQAKYLEQCGHYNASLETIRQKIQALDNLNAEARAELVAEQVRLTDAQWDLDEAWEYDLLEIEYDLYYALGLLLTFSMMVSFICPPGVLVPATVSALYVTGSVLCFTANCIRSAAGMQHEQSRESVKKERIDRKKEDFLAEFKTLHEKLERAPNDLLRMKFFYFKIMSLNTESEHEQALIEYKQRDFFRQMLLQLLFPPLMALTLLSLPMGPAAGVILAGLVVVGIVVFLLRRYDPEPELVAYDVPEDVNFDELLTRFLAQDFGDVETTLRAPMLPFTPPNRAVPT